VVVKRKRKRKAKTRRDKMRDNNTLAREWLINKGYTQIWLKQHTRHLDMVWDHNTAPEGQEQQVLKYMAQDMWNLFDGICFDSNGTLTFLAIGITFKKIPELEAFLEGKQGFDVKMIRINRKAIKVPVITTKEWGV